MSRDTYAPKEIFLGANNLAVYTFDFKIEDKAQLLVIEVDNNGVETQRVLGTDVVYLVGVVFDSVEGGGTVTLQVNLPTDFNLILLLANDLPTQPFEFRNKTTFTLRRFESALDFVLGPVMRLAYRGKQAFRIHDLDDEVAFNAQFPPGVVAAKDKVLLVNPAGDGMVFGPTAGAIAGAESQATAAAASASAAATSETNAATSAAAALVSENNAATSETNAATSETNAATSETNAATSETNAATSETNAATSETNAATSETNAATSAAAALVSENNAATSETNAATSETNAATSETNAATSETNAAASAATNNLPALSAGERGTLIGQNDADDGYEQISQGTSGQFLKSNGVDALPTFSEAAAKANTIENIGIKSVTTTNANDSIKITSADGTPLSSSNAGKIIMQGATPGEVVTFTITSDITLLLTGCDWGVVFDLTGGILNVLALNNDGSLVFGIASDGARTLVLNADDSTTQANINSAEKVLVNSALTADAQALKIGTVRSDFDLTGGAAEKLWANQTGDDDILVGTNLLIPVSDVLAITGSGYGTGNNSNTRRMTALSTNVGDDISYSTSASTGSIWIVNRTGYYGLQYADNSIANIPAGMVKNSITTTAYTSHTQDQKVMSAFQVNSGTQIGGNAVARLNMGDSIECHSDAATYAGTTHTWGRVTWIGEN